ncbi:LysR family transcriptional regulator [Cognatiyoonia sp. IB215446]|uniref:LysR family transcriptional regulator n=1 Tax=Cognatiyoonia sp. IB215446 TaxID=3097355 RepID=UPI002A0B1558|nr:LysR family transcriptional regulator [Cognatiyoonia sp. IB215446]MDX8350652.1 LysR family transcriptional regulator [Cognatiyoonia sp. IB215446]
METELLRTFAGVARLGSFAAQARKIGVDASAVSRQVAQLEAAIGITLFERTTRRLSLTDAGRLYLERALPLLDALDEVRDEVRDVVTAPSGLLKVTTSVAFGERWLLPRLPAFRETFPKIDLDLRLTDNVVDLAGEGIDLALRLGPGVEGALVAAKLFDTRYRVVTSPDYVKRAGLPTSPAALAEHDGLVFSLPGFREGWKFRTGPGHKALVASPKPTLVISNALAIRRGCLDGLGIALLADWTIGDDLAAGTLVDLFPEFDVSASGFESAAWAVYPSRSYVPARLRVFLDHLRRSAKDL